MPANLKQLDFDIKVLEGESKADYRTRMRRSMMLATRKHQRMFKSGEIPVVMDVDDFGFLLPGYDDLLRLKKSLPDFKITCFTIPLPKEFFNSVNSKQFTQEKYRKWAAIVNEQEWIEVAIHGFAHTHNEMEIGYSKAVELIQATENFFNEIGLKFVKIFKAPYWQYSYDALVALRDRGYVVAIDRNHQRPIPPGLKTYVYNWSYEEALPIVPVLKGHGHFTGRNSNNIQDTMANIVHHLPYETHFISATEYLEKYGTEN